MLTALTVLKEARAFLADPNHWTKFNFVKDNPASDCGYCCTLAGSLYIGAGFKRVDGTNSFNTQVSDPFNALQQRRSTNQFYAIRAAENIIRNHLPYGLRSVGAFNEAPDRTHSDILAILDRAIGSLELYCEGAD